MTFLGRNLAYKRAREQVMNECFAGENEGHRKAAKEAQNAVNNCNRLRELTEEHIKGDSHASM
jgi:hypothetical protein